MWPGRKGEGENGERTVCFEGTYSECVYGGECTVMLMIVLVVVVSGDGGGAGGGNDSDSSCLLSYISISLGV